MAGEPALRRDVDAAEHQPSARYEFVGVKAEAGTVLRLGVQVR
jgi:hypothetical protein